MTKRLTSMTFGWQTCFEQDVGGKLTSRELCNMLEVQCNATAWRTHYENFHPIQINNLVS
jgi:hypothetical protein